MYVTSFVLTAKGVKTNPAFTFQAFALFLARWQSLLWYRGYECNWVRSGAGTGILWMGCLQKHLTIGVCNVCINRNISEKFLHKWKNREKHRQLAETGLWWYESLFLAEVKRREEVLKRSSLLQTYSVACIQHTNRRYLALFQDMECLYLLLISFCGFGILVCSRVICSRSWQLL